MSTATGTSCAFVEAYPEARPVLGSVSARCVRESPFPVVVIPHRAAAAAEEPEEPVRAAAPRP